jgi:hypothetical protein
MCNIKQSTRQPPEYIHCTWTVVNGQRVRVIFTDEQRPAESHIVVQRPCVQPPPPSRAMIRWISNLQAQCDKKIQARSI